MKRRVKVSPGQLPLFVEKPFDSRTILVGLYDFKTCSRNSDGSFYGTSDSNQCRIGTEVSIDVMKEQMKIRNEKVMGDSKKVLSGAFSDDLTVRPASKEDIAFAEKVIAARTAELEAKLNSNADVTKELENFINDRRFLGDHMSATTIVVGMEDATTHAAGKSSEEYTKFLAEKIAKNEFKNEHPDKTAAADYANAEADKKTGFHDTHTKILTSLTGTVNSPSDMIAPGGAIAQLELRSMPAPKINPDRWMAGKVPAIANNEALNAKLGTRKAYEATYDKKMTANVSKNIMEAAKGNPNLKTVVMSMGGDGRPTANKVMLDLADQPGARYREFKYSPDGKTTLTGRIVDPTGRGAPLVYDYGASGSSRQLGSDKGAFGTGARFRSETEKLVSGQTTSTSSLRTSVNNNRIKSEKADLRARIKQAKAAGRDSDVEALQASLRGVK